MLNKALILVVEDNVLLLQQIVLTLEENGYVVMTATQSQEALEKIEERMPDVVLLDMYMPPGLDGGRTAEIIHKLYPQVAIIMMTERWPGEEARMLNLGFDFINKGKSLSLPVLLARIAKNLPKLTSAKKLVCGELEVDLVYCRAKLRGQVLDLTQRKVLVLIYLMQHPHQNIHYKKIFDNVWGDSPDLVEVSEKRKANKVSNAMTYIRKSLQDYSDLIVQTHGEGTYRWVKDVTPIE
jgi:DNA-binding response OmpR family regulator